MPWPTPQEYNEALQNPGLTFDDLELRQGSVELTSLGLPRPITGNFASVYRLKTGARDWAVRCFWREYSDMQERYAAVSSHLQVACLPYTVGFEYVPRGVRVSGAWYPILKMEWVEGVALDAFVEANLSNRAALSELAKNWLRMVNALEEARIAHGDLQHGNILVVNRDVKLVDYDCMCVPALLGKQSHEMGHQNYQHPARAEQDFGLYLDRFSSWVIYLSLLALSTDSSLWGAVKGGDECLLLRRTDFDRCRTDSTLDLLAHHQDLTLRSLARRVQSFLDLAPRDVPALAAEVDGVRSRGARAPARLFGPTRHATPRPDDSRSSSPAWVRDQALNTGKTLDGSLLVPRACLGASCMALALASLVRLPLGPEMLGASAVLADVLVLVLCFYRDPACARGRLSRWRVMKFRRSLAVLQRRIRVLEGRKENELARAERQCDALGRQRLRIEETRETRRRTVEQSLEEQLGALIEFEGELNRGECQARHATIEALRERHVHAFLASRRVWSAPISQLGRWTKIRLWMGGVRTARDVDRARLGTLRFLDGPRAAGLLAWRLRVVAEAKQAAPRRLEPRHAELVRAPFQRRRMALQRLRGLTERRHRQVLTELERHYEAHLAILEASTDTVREKCSRRCLPLDAQLIEAHENVPRLHWELAEACREQDVFARTTLARYVLRMVCPLLDRRL